MVTHVSPQSNRLETTRARPGQPAGGLTLVDSRGLHAFCARPHTLLVGSMYSRILTVQLYTYCTTMIVDLLVPYISQSAVPVQQLQVGRLIPENSEGRPSGSVVGVGCLPS